METCPRKVLAIEGDELRIIDLYACILCGECVDACTVEPPAISQGMKEDTFIFTIESTGTLPPERIVTAAARILISKLDDLSAKIKHGEFQEEIEEYEADEEMDRRLYSVGAGDIEEEEEELND